MCFYTWIVQVGLSELWAHMQFGWVSVNAAVELRCAPEQLCWQLSGEVCDKFEPGSGGLFCASFWNRCNRHIWRHEGINTLFSSGRESFTESDLCKWRRMQWPVPGKTCVVVVSPLCTFISPCFPALAIPVRTQESWKHDALPLVQRVSQSINKRGECELYKLKNETIHVVHTHTHMCENALKC